MVSLLDKPTGRNRHLQDDPAAAPPKFMSTVDHPPHYNNHPSGVECITIVEHMNFCLGNAVKYIWRASMKGGIEDLEKAKWYIQREIDRLNVNSTD